MTFTSMSLNSQRELCHVCCGTRTGKPVSVPAHWCLVCVIAHLVPSSVWTVEGTLPSPLFWEGNPTHFSIDKLKLCRSMISGKFVYKKIVTNPTLNSMCSNQDYNATFSNFVKTNRQNNSHQKEQCILTGAMSDIESLKKCPSRIAVLSDIHCCMTTIWGTQAQSGFWCFVCSIPSDLAQWEWCQLPAKYLHHLYNEWSACGGCNAKNCKKGLWRKTFLFI